MLDVSNASRLPRHSHVDSAQASAACLPNFAILLLQVQVGADALTIKRKYKELAVALHPDKCKVSLLLMHMHGSLQAAVTQSLAQ